MFPAHKNLQRREILSLLRLLAKGYMVSGTLIFQHGQHIADDGAGRQAQGQAGLHHILSFPLHPAGW